jgi:hypothetical protein
MQLAGTGMGVQNTYYSFVTSGIIFRNVIFYKMLQKILDVPQKI